MFERRTKVIDALGPRTALLSETLSINEIVRANTRAFCASIARREPLHGFTQVVFVGAHADDEVIGYGTVLSQIPNALAIQVTDSAPKVPKHIEDPAAAERFKTRIRAVRRDELTAALNLAGHNPARRECLGEADQDVMNRMGATAAALAERFEKNKIAFVLTHAYEGGHPDHDAVAASVHLAKEILARKGIYIGIIETPLYKGVPGDQTQRIWQEFADGVSTSSEDTFIKILTPREQALKRAMYAAHASQAHIFTNTFDDRELFRVAPNYDFSVPPNNGHVTNIFPEFGLTHEKWLDLISEARRQVRL